MKKLISWLVSFGNGCQGWLNGVKAGIVGEIWREIGQPSTNHTTLGKGRNLMLKRREFGRVNTHTYLRGKYQAVVRGDGFC